MKKYRIFLIGLSLLLCAFPVSASKILYVASYHVEKGEWTAGIKTGIDKVLSGRKNVTLKVFNMDTRLARSEREKENAALSAHQLIQSWKPDLVITSDDNAAKYLIAQYYENADLPFVFCGVNWDASVYGLPFSNTTGMIEVQLISQIIDHLLSVSNGSRIGILRGDTMTNRKEQDHFEIHTQKKFNVKYAYNLSQWEKGFVQLQKETDLVVLGSLGALDLGENTMGDVKAFVMENTKVPTGAYDAFMKEVSLVTLSTIPEEQGEWAANTALQILDGASPQDIPLAVNKKGKLFLNMGLARLMDIKFPMDLIERSHLVSAESKKLLFINSYHKGYQWSDDIEKGLFKALGMIKRADGSIDDSNALVKFRLFRMDTKRNTSEAFKKQAAAEAKRIIDHWQPDIVITSDDNAVKYLISPYYNQSDIPFVFCGLNWDASAYGLPFTNITGMLEVSPVKETIQMLNLFSDGKRIGIIGADNISNQKEVFHHKKELSIEYAAERLVSDFDTWKREYLALQDTVDMLIHLSPVGITDWDEKDAHNFILAHTKIPSGAISDSNAHYTLLGNVSIAAEQGWWSGKTAMAILNGKPISHIPMTRNKESRLILNLPLAKRLKIKFPLDMLEEASLIEKIGIPGE